MAVIKGESTINMKQLVIGLGQVGSAVHEVLGSADGHDPFKNIHTTEAGYEVLHVCIPWSEEFIQDVLHYQDRFLIPSGLTIIHSTVPVGTSEIIGAVHSPIRGVHPHLAAGIRTFVKVFGGPRAEEAAAIFASLGITTRTTSSSRDTEALKLWDTSYYGWNIVYEKLLHQWCEENGVDFNLVYTEGNQTYNDGYTKLGMPNVVRPVLKHYPGPIGGHCVIPNAEILAGSPIADFIIETNKKCQD